MVRTLDLTALRSFVAVADAGGVTRAAVRMNLTQSAVSMQLKRLEEFTGQPLLDRSARTVALTPQGEQLLGYARRMLALNDEAWGRLTSHAFEGEVNFGAPHDVIYPHVPQVLRDFTTAYPRVKVRLHSMMTTELKAMLARGELDLILTTEAEAGPGGEVLAREPLVWAGAPGGQAWRTRPLRFATSNRCIFKRSAIDALEGAGLPWELAVDAFSDAVIEASVSADLGVSVHLAGSVPAKCEPIRAGLLPPLPVYAINMYVDDGPRAALAERLADCVRAAYCCGDRVAAE